MTTTSQDASPWLTEQPAAAPPAAAPPAAGELTADVTVIGAGITGVTTALLLARAGLDVAVCEARTVGSGVTGLNTAKVSALQGTLYSTLTDRHGSAVAAAYAQASLAGVAAVAELAAAHAEDCGLSWRPAATVAGSPAQVAAIEQEHAAAAAAGLPVRRVDSVDAPIPCHGAVLLADQLTLHPVRYVRGLMDTARAAGVRLYENSRVLGVSAGEPCVVRTDLATIRTGHVVVASHYPMLDRGLYFARLEALRSYCVAGRIRGEAPQALAITAGSPTRSFASVAGLAILGGEGHAAGATSADADRFARLEEDLRAWCDIEDVGYRWSAQDPVSFDKLPVIGSYGLGSEHLWVASGYGKWGLSTGTFAAKIIADSIVGRTNEWAEVFRPARVPSLRSLPTLAKLAGKVALDMVGDRLRPGDASSAEDIAPGEAGVVRTGHRRAGVYRDPEGALHSVSLRCTHLGCLLRFNSAETSWDCPCHGSRFDVDGAVLEGPAVHPLDREEI